MNRILVLFIIGLLVVGCQKENRTDYVINGTATGVVNGIRVYLKSVDKKGREIVNDTAIIMNEKFTMAGKVEAPEVRFLSVDNVQGDFIFMIENSEIDIEINKDIIFESQAKGSKTHNDLVDYQAGMKQFQDDNRGLITTYRSLKMPQDSEKKDSIRKILEEIGKRWMAYPIKFISEHNDSYFSLNLVGLEANKPKFDVEAYIEAYEKLTPRLKNTPKGIEVREKLDSINVEFQKIAYLEIGKVAPNFEAPTPSGDIVTLDELKGKVTLIDFWAAWCGPCRRENPNVVRIYNKYHKEGLEIIGVSLDGTSRQNDPKKAWLDAIEKDQLAWNHVSYLKYFNDPVAIQYNISAIPATFLLDENGVIVAKNLRGKALELRVQKLLEK